jgi:hypothetical protein
MAPVQTRVYHLVGAGLLLVIDIENSFSKLNCIESDKAA